MADMNEKLREEFKKHRTSIAAHLIKGDDWAGAYRLADGLVSLASFSAGWRASRAALVIELPEPYAVIGDYAACGGGRAVWDSEFAERIDDRMCEKTAVYDRAGLEAAGVRVKP
ncbi:hypothetical protein [Pseudomonas typographi]|uniref:Phage protein n=1 Tax=Pseudomonas typographi TaxID=2715964 RepID=A0ABR7Z9N0_9PSED|nr:hypothetical protein [Pseudomonas typographi]MBD1601963.1 hypothetical protein [Pseudomonas typographi]